MESEKKKKIVKDVMAYGASGYISQGIGIFISFLIRRFLGPVNMGIWSLVNMIVDYALVAHLGTGDALYFKIPFHIGKNDKKEAETVQNVVFTFFLLISIPIIIMVLIAGVIYRDRMPKELFVGLMVFPIIYIGQRFYTYFIMLLRAHKQFALLGKSFLFDSIVDLLLIILLVWKLKLYGMYLASILLPLCNIAYVQAQARFNLKFHLLWGKLKDYIRFGLPLFLISYLYVLLYSVDRIMIAKMIGMAPLGYYSIAVMSKNYSLTMTKSFGSVISPYFIEDFGRVDDITKIKHYVTTYAEITSCVASIFLGFIYIGFPVAVYYFLPKFLPGINAMKGMLLCTFFMLVAGQLHNLLVLKKKQSLLIATVISAISLNIIGNYLLIKAGFGITGVSLSSAFSTFFVFIIFSFLGMRYLHNLAGMPLFIARVFIPLVFTVLILFFLERFMIFPNIILECILRLLIFSLYSLAIVYYINRQTGLVGVLFSIVKDRLRYGKNK